jgi:hypothetical protein
LELLVSSLETGRPDDPPSPAHWDVVEVHPIAGTSDTVGRIELSAVAQEPDVVRRAPDDLVGVWRLQPERSSAFTEVVRFTSHGEELGRWSLPTDERTSDYVVRVHEGRVFVIYLREVVPRRRNRVELLELGCVP